MNPVAPKKTGNPSFKRFILTALLFGLIIGLIIGAPVLAARLATIIQTSSHRQITDPVYPQPSEQDGSIVVTLSSDRPIDLATANDDFQRLDAYTFTTRFPWNWDGPRSVSFTDDLGEETAVEVAPGLAVPFQPLQHQIPVLHITCDSTALWDPETGIYTTGNHDNFLQYGPEWERPARFEYYLPFWGKVVNEEIGLRINGGYGRNYHQKGLRFYFDGYGESNHLEYPFFGPGPADFERLVLRPSRYDDYCINSNLAETLFADLGHLASRYRFVAVYLNREYWGAYSLRERLDDEFFTRTWDLGYGGLNLIKDGFTEHGDSSSWWQFLEDIAWQGNPQDPQWLAWVQENLDLASYIDWQIINLYCVAGDNGFQWNLALFQTGEQPWRVVMWDEDTLFRNADLPANLFRFSTARNQAEWELYQAPADERPWNEEDQRWLTMFRTLLGNAEFRGLFRSRLEHLLGSAMGVDPLMARVDALAVGQLPEIPAHADRWQGFQANWYEGNLDRTKQWITDRRGIFLAQADSFFAEFSLPAWTAESHGLVINEYLASNSHGARDEAGDHEDWVELYNSGSEPVNLTGMYLTDDLSQSQKWEFPAVSLRPGEHLIVWCDDDAGQGPLHANFNLSADGEEIALFGPAAFGNQIIDSRVFGPQVADISEGRMPDGSAIWAALNPPTFNAANDDSSDVPPYEPIDLVLRQNYPNPFNPGTTLEVELPKRGRARLQVFDSRGRLVATLLDEEMETGLYPVQWQGVDNGGRAVASGLYLARLEFAGEVQTRRMTLIR